jgi:hypothetical protein
MLCCCFFGDIFADNGAYFSASQCGVFLGFQRVARNGTRSMKAQSMKAHFLLLKWRADVAASRNCQILTGCFTLEQARNFVGSTVPSRKVQRKRCVP